VQLLATHAERIAEALMWAGPVAVEGDGEVVHAQFGHAGMTSPGRATHRPGEGTDGTLAVAVPGPVHLPSWGT